MQRMGCTLKWVVTEPLPRLTSEDRLEGSEGTGLVDIWEEEQ